MSAEFVDALKGYEYYLKQRGKASLDDINKYLESHERRPIQLRTYGHYRKLLANGFRSYIPINKFDVFQSLGLVQMAGDRRRYEREKVQIPARISFDGEKWDDCEIIDKSLVGFGIAISGKVNKTKGSKIWIMQEGYYDIPAILVWKEIEGDDFSRFGLRAFEFVARYQLEESEIRAVRLTGIIKIVREQEGDLNWDDLFRILSETNKLIESTSELIYTISEVLDKKIHLARPVVSSIEFGSPGELQTKVDLGIAEILKTLIEKFQYWSLEKKRYKEENRKKELENINYGVDIVRNAINLRKEAIEAGMTDEAIYTVLDPIKKVFNAKELPKDLFDDGSLERAILAERVMPAIAELIAGDDPDFKITVPKVK